MRFLSVFANAAICTMFAHYNVDLVGRDDAGKSDEEMEELLEKHREQYIKNNVDKYISKKNLY